MVQLKIIFSPFDTLRKNPAEANVSSLVALPKYYWTLSICPSRLRSLTFIAETVKKEETSRKLRM